MIIAQQMSVHPNIVPLWQGLDKVVNEYLDGITIADLVQNGQPGDDYVI